MQTKWTLMGFVVLMFAASAVLAQTTSSLSTEQGMGRGGMAAGAAQPSGVELCRGSSLIGSRVVNAQGQDLGKIHDIVLNSQRDQIGYAVLAHGGIAGVGDKLIAIPWSEFQVQTMAAAAEQQSPSQQQQHQHQRLVWNRDQRIELTLPVSKDQLSRVQGFSREAWPEQASANWQQQSYLETMPMSGAQKTAFDTRKLSRIIGMKVESSTPITFRETSSSGMTGSQTRRESREEARQQSQAQSTGRTDIGKVRDCVLNADNGRLIYCVVSLSEVSGHTREMSVVPWEAIRVDQQKQIARLHTTSGDSLLAFTFQPNQQPDLADRDYLERVYTAYNVEPQWEALGFVPPSGESRQQQMQRQQQQRRQQPGSSQPY